MAEVAPPVIPQYSGWENCGGNFIPNLLYEIFLSKIYPLMCKSMQNNDAQFLTSLCAWRSVCDAWKTLTLTNIVWLIFEMAKTDVSNSHWPNFVELNVNQLTYDAWLRFFITLKHVGEGTEVKTNLHLMSQAKLKKYKNEQIASLEGFEYGYYNESSYDCQCKGLSRAPCCILRNIMHHKCRAPKSLVDPLEGPSLRQCGRSWNLEHDPDFQH
jgi:hypothetical protein